MQKIDRERIGEILSDPSFCALVDEMKSALVRKVMARSTPDEDRANALAEHHALERLEAHMRSVHEAGIDYD